jgi:hypothetical protein
MLVFFSRGSSLHADVDHQAKRKMFLLASQLKQAYKSKHKARLAESKASFTKRRFANYIFHEVRVPLNNAGNVAYSY